MKALLLRFRTNVCGTTAIEYALIASIVSIAIAASLYQTAPSIQANFTAAADAFKQ
jgi:Flp pilus assembly pilin Flp